MPERDVNAEHVVESGISRRRDPGALAPADLQPAVDGTTSNAELIDHLEHLHAEIHAAGGAPAGADEVEQRLASNS